MELTRSKSCTGALRGGRSLSPLRKTKYSYVMENRKDRVKFVQWSPLNSNNFSQQIPSKNAGFQIKEVILQKKKNMNFVCVMWGFEISRFENRGYHCKIHICLVLEEKRITKQYLVSVFDVNLFCHFQKWKTNHKSCFTHKQVHDPAHGKLQR